MSDTCRATRIQICSRISTRIAVSFGAHRLERGPFYGAQRRPRSACNSGALLQSEWTGYPTSLFRRMTALRQKLPVTIIMSEALDQACRKPREAGTLTSASLIASSFWSIATYWPCQ